MSIRERIIKEIEIQKEIDGELCQHEILLKYLNAVTTKEQWLALINVKHYPYGKLSYETHRFYYPKKELLKFLENLDIKI